ncbi:NAD(P)/FAD-dependent oxidoreductase [Enemella evansiae]|uniref:NAD(P)/FAD-dependent oxidoreductase n=1 Tax=Enemella evansiae TaxID=2016499 RepID=UPI00105FCB72|nr:FAD-binding oxidoreductase [Enemella evansiae]TDO88121.1 glycine/D-amino acid oxidase-like deaminating enzyme [Enemella evansiae]
MVVPQRASVVIIGGGVMGVAAAYELARSGIAEVVLLDRGSFGAGSTCRAAGGVRAQFSDELNIQLGARSLATFENFGRLFDTEIDLHQVGYLFLIDNDEAVATFENNARLQQSLGLESRIISPAEAKRLSPLIDTDGLIAAAWTPRDGHCTPEAVVSGYARAARRAGATLLPNCAVTGIDVADEAAGARITGVCTAAGTIATDTVICTAGAWSGEIASWVGVDLPVEPLKRQLLITEDMPGLAPDTPFTIDQSSTLYFHNEGRGLLVGMSYADQQPGFDQTVTDDWLEPLSAAIDRRVPALAEVGMSSGWAGLYENTPDHNALIGEARGVSRFLYATGFSGHGFLQGPAVGEVLRDLYREQRPFVDVSALSADRFHSADRRPEFNIV